MIPPGDDIDRLMAVMHAAFDPAFAEAWTRRQVEDALLIGNCSYALIGATGTWPGTGEPAAGFFPSRYGFEEEELLLLAIAPEFRGRGLATQLLTDLQSKAESRGARRLLLEMRRGNPAERLYRASGFVPIGERLNYYRAPSGQRLDAITFSKTLQQT
ncbi:MAG: GNAT family N-acetyltransferase [Sphingomonadales bacterium]|nr:GNAT family N-acetyltransferase [Sphingomonadales bacterium]